tara:strand:- start:9535 stop:10419 length:885 start_codon:yes stop_codon:yes gene_type:complete
VIIQYKEISDLEEIIDEATREISDGLSFNLCMSYDFAVDLLTGDGLRDCTEEAELWLSDEVPDQLHINHGSYVRGGMSHLVDELKRKPTSNRALLSLLSQKDVNESGDDPIPSFMVFQVSIYEDILYCTVYFRALEVSSFFRINIEEIRLRLKYLHLNLMNFKRVRLVMHSYRAYNNPKASKLRKSELDLMRGAQIMKTVMTDPARFGPLLREKSQDDTVICSDSLQELEVAVGLAENLPTKPRLIALIRESIMLTDELSRLRKMHSHHERVSEASGRLSQKVLSLAEAFEQCR